MQQVIEWSTGSRDKIYVDYDYGSFDDTLSITSDANTGAARSKTIHVTAGNITRNIVVSQDAGTPQPEFHTYIKFDGTAYIDTSIVPPANFSIAVPCSNETQKKAQHIFACGSPDYFSVAISSSNSTNRTVRLFYGKSSYVAQRNLQWSYKSYGLFVTPSRWGWGDSTQTFTKGSATPSQGIRFGTSRDHSGNPFTGRTGIIRIYDSNVTNATTYSNLLNNNTPLYTLRPCIYNGEAGLWCVETSSFYGNSASSGTLEVRDS